MKPLSSIKAVMGATGVALALASGSAMAELFKKTVRKIANQGITKRSPALIGATGARGPQGPTGATTSTGATRTAGPAAIQRYVRVFFDGTVDASQSLGVGQANVARLFGRGGPFYCLTGLPLVRGGQVSVDFDDAVSNDQWAEDNDIDDPDDCGGNSSSFIDVTTSAVAQANPATAPSQSRVIHKARS